MYCVNFKNSIYLKSFRFIKANALFLNEKLLLLMKDLMCLIFKVYKKKISALFLFN